MDRILLVSLLFSLGAAEKVVTQTVVLVQSSTGFATLTGTAASQALATTASGGAAGLAQPNDGLGVPEGGVGSTNDGNAGNDGSDVGSYSISTGAIIGISVGIALLILVIFVIWLLWFLAKKRGWDVRKSISRASRRLTGRFNDSRARRASTRNAVRMDSPPSRSKDRDLEKGKGEKIQVKAVAVDTSPSGKKERRAVAIQPPTPSSKLPATVGSSAPAAGGKSGFDAETPVGKSFREKYMQRHGST
ncbi:hypothetical protein NA57DRAFT_77118 [Rhizodiscina lignyota]|uniref:Uncharacterized protein n=1 Tax=Rhizodiscina lignyota TaxID=1504668 RepID=A0A9P4IFS9_9PEZI|nr:hypothetical protein NA57DRAFT_77118 [Rhizodiscina lignyota]